MIASRPQWLTVEPSSIPQDLVKTDAWVVWRGEPVANKPVEWTKIPYRAKEPGRKASSTDPQTWASFSDAFMAYQSDPSIHGVGYVLHDEGITGIDLDDAFAPDGQLSPGLRRSSPRSLAPTGSARQAARGSVASATRNCPQGGARSRLRGAPSRCTTTLDS